MQVTPIRIGSHHCTYERLGAITPRFTRNRTRHLVWCYRITNGIRLTLGLLVEIPKVLPLLLVDDGQNSSDRLSDTVAILSVHTLLVVDRQQM